MEEIWVVCHPTTFNHEHTLQLLTKARDLVTHHEGRVTAIAMGPYQEEAFQELTRHGASRIIYTHQENPYGQQVEILTELIDTYRPSLLLFSATQYAKGLAATLSSRFEAGLTADCIDIEMDDDGMYTFSRAAMNDSVIARIKCMNSTYQMCTVKENVFVAVPLEEAPEPRIETFHHEGAHHRTMVQIIESKLRESRKSANLNKAKVIFGIGRGVGQDTLSRIEKLAIKYDAAIAGTRAAVEENLIEKGRQVGQSGISICPQLYIGFGISGASQHIVGIKNAEVIVAINNNRQAPIFDYADYGIVDDIEVVLDALEEYAV